MRFKHLRKATPSHLSVLHGQFDDLFSIALDLPTKFSDHPYPSKKAVNMILELADIRIHPGQQIAFDEAIQNGLTTVISQAQGFRGFKVNKGIENPERYLLQIFWETLEDHTVGFRQSPAFTQWRAIVGPYFAQAPNVEHFELLAKSA